MKASMPAPLNGHTPPAAEIAERAARVQQRRRETTAAYAGLSDELLDSFEHLALVQAPHAQLGALALIVAIRWRRAKERERATA